MSVDGSGVPAEVAPQQPAALPALAAPSAAVPASPAGAAAAASGGAAAIDVMPGLYTVGTTHGTVFACVDGRDLLSHEADPEAPVLLYRPPAFPAVAFLLPRRALHLESDPWVATMLSLRVWGDDTVGFAHPLTGLLLSAPPPDAEGGRVLADRTAQGPWETFALRPVAFLRAEPLLPLLSTIDRVLPACVSGPAMLQLLESSDEISPELLQAMGRLLPADHSAWLGAMLLQRPAALNGLTARLLGDLWAAQALPELAGWLAAPDHATHVRRCGRDCDVLEVAGSDGRPVSFAQTLNISARAAVTPRRGLCVLACLRDEGVHLLDWIAHHRALGVEHFFLYSNDNTDGSDDLLAALARAGEITWVVNDVPPGTLPQYKAYGHALQMLPEILDYRWVAVIDLDEALAFDTALHASFADYLAWQERESVDAIALNWVVFGSSGLAAREPRPVVERFLRRHAVDRHVKSLYRPRRFVHAQAHYPVAPFGQAWTFRGAEGGPHPQEREGNAAAFSPRPSDRQAWVAHYAMKSAEEFALRRSRNAGDRAVTRSLQLDLLGTAMIEGFLDQHRPDWEEADERATVFADAAAGELARLSALPDVAAAAAAVERAYAAAAARLRQEMRDSARFQVRGSPENRLLRALAAGPALAVVGPGRQAVAVVATAPLREPGCYRLLSCDGSEVFVAAQSAMLVTADGVSHDRIATMAIVPRARRDLLMLMESTEEEAAAFRLRPGALRNTAHLFEAHWVGDGGHVTLLDPSSGRFASAPPPADPEEAAPVPVDREEAGEWEAFSLEPVRDIFVPRTVRARAEAIEAMLAGGVDMASVLALVTADRPFAAEVLNAVLPLLRLDELQGIGRAVVASDELTRRLAAVFPGDVWAAHALPALAEMLGVTQSAPAPSRGFGLLRRPGRARREEAEASPHRRVVDAAYDGVTAGTTGAFASFPHAVAVQARSTVAPTRGPCVVATLRSEGPYLLEWVAYHRAIGFEAFYLYSNDNEDGSDALLGALADAGAITWLANRVADGGSARARAYGHAFSVLPEVLAHRWVLTADADEFLVFDPERFGSVNDYLAWQERRSVDAVAVNWLPFGSGDAPGWPDTPLVERNTRVLNRRHLGEEVRLVKTLARPAMMMQSGAHAPVTDERRTLVYRAASGELHGQSRPGSDPDGLNFAATLRTEAAAVHHYLFKSAEEWAWKKSRNSGDGGLERAPQVMAQADAHSFMRQHRAADVVIDDRASRCAPALREGIAALRALPGVAAAEAAMREACAARMARIGEAYRSDPSPDGWDVLGRRFLQLGGFGPAPARPAGEAATNQAATSQAAPQAQAGPGEPVAVRPA